MYFASSNTYTMRKLLLMACLVTATLFVSCSTPNNDPAIGDGVINGWVDGVFVKQINLWSSTKEGRQIQSTVKDSAPVDILDIVGDYYYVRSATNHTQYGFVNKQFVSGVTWSKKQ